MKAETWRWNVSGKIQSYELMWFCRTEFFNVSQGQVLVTHSLNMIGNYNIPNESFKMQFYGSQSL